MTRHVTIVLNWLSMKHFAGLLGLYFGRRFLWSLFSIFAYHCVAEPTVLSNLASGSLREYSNTGIP